MPPPFYPPPPPGPGPDSAWLAQRWTLLDACNVCRYFQQMLLHMRDPSSLKKPSRLIQEAEQLRRVRARERAENARQLQALRDAVKQLDL